MKKKPKSVIGLFIGIGVAAFSFWLDDMVNWTGDIPLFWIIIIILAVFGLIVTAYEAFTK